MFSVDSSVAASISPVGGDGVAFSLELIFLLLLPGAGSFWVCPCGAFGGVVWLRLPRGTYTARSGRRWRLSTRKAKLVKRFERNALKLLPLIRCRLLCLRRRLVCGHNCQRNRNTISSKQMSPHCYAAQRAVFVKSNTNSGHRRNRWQSFVAFVY